MKQGDADTALNWKQLKKADYGNIIHSQSKLIYCIPRASATNAYSQKAQATYQLSLEPMGFGQTTLLD